MFYYCKLQSTNNNEINYPTWKTCVQNTPNKNVATKYVKGTVSREKLFN